MHPPLVAIATVPPRGNQECANEVYRKAISLACPLGEGAEHSEAEGGGAQCRISLSKVQKIFTNTLQKPNLHFRKITSLSFILNM